MTDPLYPAFPLRLLLKKYQIKPAKRWGQVFLSDEGALNKVLRSAALTPEKEVLEIGAGVGSLTRLLAQAAKRVVAVEIDSRLIPPLEEALNSFSNVKIIQGDILRLNPALLMEEEGYVVVANIPYYITSAIVRHLLEGKRKPSQLVLTIQREVAQRICAQPGALSLLALSVQVYGNPKIACTIPAGAFYPMPKVDSAVLLVSLYDQPCIAEEQLAVFFRLIKIAFAQKRKTMRNALAAGLGWQTARVQNLLEKAQIDGQRRAETLSIAEWQNLVSVFYEENS